MGTLPVRMFPQAERISRLVRLGLGAAEAIDRHYDSNGGEKFQTLPGGHEVFAQQEPRVTVG
jgi:hypothetical protein